MSNAYVYAPIAIKLICPKDRTPELPIKTNSPITTTKFTNMVTTVGCSAEEIAGMVAYLAGPEAGYITGASLNIDGGFSA